MLTGSNFIGSRESREDPGVFRAQDPATGTALEPAFAEATPAEVDAAARAAQAAFEAYAALPPPRHAAFLRAIAEQLVGLGDALLERAGSETALPRPRLEGERGRTANQARLFADLVEEGSWVDARIDRAQPDRKPLPKPDLRRMLVPLGPVAVFGASNFPLAVRCGSKEALLATARRLQGHLTATVHATERDLAAYGELLPILARKAGRVVLNGMPTGVEVTHAMQHGGPWPATTDPRATSVGTAAILRFARPVSYQDFPDAALPEELRGPNPRGIWRLVDGQPTREAL